ncbi:MAG: TPM domain-containing protein [Chloracidobacterium sp.]|nr:TPM domain-containing protein [Chloracidobacterium sp.]
MKRNFLPRQLKPLLIFLAILLAGLTAFSQENQPWSQNTSPLPPPTGFVNDYAGVIDPATKQALETKLKNLKDTTNPSVEIAVAVVKTTGERAIFDYSLAVARGWKIGSVDDDNPSALLLIAIDDRKYFTQVSKDLEDELPDGVVGSLQRQFLVPEFKKANYAKGISDTIDAYIATIRNKGNTSGNANTIRQPSSDNGSGGAFFGLFCCAVIILIVIVILIASRNHKGGGPSAGDRNRWGGGGFGGGGGGSSGSDIASAVIGGIIGAALSGGSSSSSSDSGSSSGGDWGGFGGGGDFGGGGAGGDW